MAKPRIPNKEVTLRSPEDTERLAMAAQIETILGHAKYRLTLLAAFAFLLLGLLITGAQNLHQLNTQGIAYLLLAKHYAAGEFGLAISSYWSPFLSWLIAAGLKMGWTDPTAARVATGTAALLFWVASMATLFVCQLPIRALLLGAWLLSFAAIHWSVEYISPDLLAAGLLLAAIASSLFTFRVRHRGATILSGILWGSVYYANAMFLPAVVACLVGFSIAGHFGTKENAKPWLPTILTQSVIALLTMAPWWATLSKAYDRPTIGSVWAIDHAVAGPKDIDRYHPCFGQFNPPSEGRISNWEDPARLDYATWSPFANEDNKLHQSTLLKRNLKSTLQIFREFGAFGLGIATLLTCFFFRTPFNRSLLSGTWRWAIFPIAGLVVGFLPFVVTPLDTRFFYSCYPLLMMAAFGFLDWLPKQFDWAKFPNTFASSVVAVLFALPIIPRLASSLEGVPNPGGYVALDLVDRIETAQIKGTIAGDALLMGSRTGLFIAALLNEKWIGDSPDVIGTDYISNGADLIIVHRQHRVNSDMEFNPAFRDLDTVLFPDKMQAEEFPLRVYQVNR